MKKIFLFILCMTVVVTSYGQTEHFQKGQTNIQASIGIHPVAEFKQYKFEYPAPYLSFDYAFDDVTTMGAFVSFATVSISDWGAGSERYKVNCYGLRSTAHPELIPSIDLYAGGTLGIRRKEGYMSYALNIDNSYYSTSSFDYSLFAGAKYMFFEKVGGFIELNFNAVSAVNIGLSIKILK